MSALVQVALRVAETRRMRAFRLSGTLLKTLLVACRARAGALHSGTPSAQPVSAGRLALRDKTTGKRAAPQTRGAPAPPTPGCTPCEAGL